MIRVRSVTLSSPVVCAELAEVVRNVAASGVSVDPSVLEDAERHWQTTFADLGSSLRVWVAEVDSRAVGAVKVAVEDTEARVRALLVHSHWQGRGLASRLLNAVDAWLLEADVEALVLEPAVTPATGQFFLDRGWSAITDLEEGPVRYAKPLVLEDADS